MPAFIDANIVVHATGSDDQLKLACRTVLELAGDQPGACVTSAEVLQELLHVGLRRGRLQRVSEMLESCLLAVSGAVEPVHGSDVLWAYAQAPVNSLQARDLVHLAVMNRLGITSIVSSDRAFDRVQGIARLDPLELDSWRSSVFA